MKYLKLFENYYNSDIPSILYHTSDFLFDLFDLFELKSGYRTHMINSVKVKSNAIFLTDDIEASKNYGNKYIYKCKISCNRVLDWSENLDIRSYSWISKNYGDIIPYNSDEYWMLLDDDRICEYLNNRGVDCVVLIEYSDITNDTFQTYAVLNPENISIIETEDINK